MELLLSNPDVTPEKRQYVKRGIDWDTDGEIYKYNYMMQKSYDSYYCEVCDQEYPYITKHAHLNTKKHKNNLALHEHRIKTPDASSCNSSVSSEEEIKPRKQRISRSIDWSNDEERRNYKNMMNRDNKWECVVCNATMMRCYKNTHIKTKKHQINEELYG